jgi:regulator of protease activity HflC (stomatin/prohibitin superfamily)
MFYFAEGDQQEQINQAQGEAQGLLSRAQARAKSLELLSAALENKVLQHP